MRRMLGAAMAAAMLVAGTPAPAVLPERVSVRRNVPAPVDADNPKHRERAKRRLARRRATQVAQAAAARRRGRGRWQHPMFQRAVNRLSGWQRSQWAAAGYPGLVGKETDRVLRFAMMRHGSVRP